MSTLRQLNPTAFQAWLEQQGLTRYQLEHKSGRAGIQSRYWRRWAAGQRITQKLQQKLRGLGAPDTIFKPLEGYGEACDARR